MWTNVCCSKYSHSRVTNFKTHLKHNNHFTKLINSDIYLPEHVRKSKPEKFFRFLLYPLSLAGFIMYFNNYPEYTEIYDLCKKRHLCHGQCITDNFPDNICKEVEYNIVYNGNHYKYFFEYPDPYSFGIGTLPFD